MVALAFCYHILPSSASTFVSLCEEPSFLSLKNRRTACVVSSDGCCPWIPFFLFASGQIAPRYRDKQRLRCREAEKDKKTSAPSTAHNTAQGMYSTSCLSTHRHRPEHLRCGHNPDVHKISVLERPDQKVEPRLQHPVIYHLGGLSSPTHLSHNLDGLGIHWPGGRRLSHCCTERKQTLFQSSNPVFLRFA